MLFRDCDLATAKQLVQEIQDKTQPYEFSWAGEISEITTSIGLVSINRDIKSVTDIFSIAETACNVAKDHGRKSNPYC